MFGCWCVPFCLHLKRISREILKSKNKFSHDTKFLENQQNVDVYVCADVIETIMYILWLKLAGNDAWVGL